MNCRHASRSGAPPENLWRVLLVPRVARILANRSPSVPTTGLINPLNAKLNPICPLLALLGAHHILHISGLRVNEILEVRPTREIA